MDIASVDQVLRTTRSIRRRRLRATTSSLITAFKRARDIFVRRHQMTRGTIAYATRLVAATQSASGRGSSSNQ